MFNLDIRNNQNVLAASQVIPNCIVKLEKNLLNKITDVYFKNEYIGSYSKIIDKPYAKVISYEKLYTRYNFDLEPLDENEFKILVDSQSKVIVPKINFSLLNKIIERSIGTDSEFIFDGFYHMTHYENLNSILKTGKLFSRAHNAMKIDMSNLLPETESVLSHTSIRVKNKVRFFFRPKNPTFWYFEKNGSMAILKFNKQILLNPSARISIGNAGKSYIDFITPAELIQYDISDIFKSSKHMIQTELLVPNYVELNQLEAVYFKSELEITKFIEKYGDNGLQCHRSRYLTVQQSPLMA